MVMGILVRLKACEELAGDLDYPDAFGERLRGNTRLRSEHEPAETLWSRLRAKTTPEKAAGDADDLSEEERVVRGPPTGA